MKTLLIVTAALFSIGNLASANYQEGTFHCKSSGGENVYSVHTVNLGNVTVPYVEATLHYHQDIGNPNSPVQESVVKGFAAESTTGGETTLLVAALRLEFDNGELQHCKQ